MSDQPYDSNSTAALDILAASPLFGRLDRAARAELADHLELVNDRFGSSTVAGLFGYGRGFGLPSEVDVAEVRRIMQHRSM